VDKAEILKALKNSSAWERPNKDNYWWKIAFDEYQKNNSHKVSLTCGRCYPKVKQWLEK